MYLNRVLKAPPNPFHLKGCQIEQIQKRNQISQYQYTKQIDQCNAYFLQLSCIYVPNKKCIWYKTSPLLLLG